MNIEPDKMMNDPGLLAIAKCRSSLADGIIDQEDDHDAAVNFIVSCLYVANIAGTIDENEVHTERSGSAHALTKPMIEMLSSTTKLDFTLMVRTPVDELSDIKKICTLIGGLSGELPITAVEAMTKLGEISEDKALHLLADAKLFTDQNVLPKSPEMRQAWVAIALSNFDRVKPFAKEKNFKPNYVRWMRDLCGWSETRSNTAIRDAQEMGAIEFDD